MKARIPHTLAILLLAGAAPLAYSQAGSKPLANFVDEPVASVSRADDLANAVAQALSADASLKNSKITVQPDEGGVILLTGATLTDAQRRKAAQIATTQAGEGKVVNALMTDEIVLYAPPPQESLEQPEQPASEPAEGVLSGTSS
jgi:hypothetical protein